VEVERGAGGVVLVLVCGVSDMWGQAGVAWTHHDFCMLHVSPCSGGRFVGGGGHSAGA
jgi:hypothetical protein